MTARGTVLVTGASGFIGPHLVRHLAANGWQVRAAARGVHPGLMQPGVEVCMLPDLARIVWRPLLSGVTHVVHLAGIAHAAKELSADEYMKINAHSVRSLGEAARSAGIKRVVFLSSVRAQTGPAAGEVLNETMPPRPTDAYGRSKLAGEQALAEVLAGSATSWVTLRPVLVYGPGVKRNMKSLFDLARSPWPLPLGSLKAKRSILTISNLSSAVAHALESDAAANGTYLIADDAPVTMPEIIAALRAGMDRSPRMLPFPTLPIRLALRAAGQQKAAERLFGDLIVDTRAFRATGWQPVESTSAALASAIRSE